MNVAQLRWTSWGRISYGFLGKYSNIHDALLFGIFLCSTEKKQNGIANDICDRIIWSVEYPKALRKSKQHGSFLIASEKTIHKLDKVKCQKHYLSLTIWNEEDTFHETHISMLDECFVIGQ